MAGDPFTSNSNVVANGSTATGAGSGVGGDGAGDAGQKQGQEHGKSDKNHGLPGSSWLNKKAQEDYEKAMSGLTDKNWSMARFGDLFEPPQK